MNKHDKIFDPCELASDFLTPVNEDKKLYFTLVDPQLVCIITGPQVVFFIHICEENNRYRTLSFFYSHKKRKKMILHTCVFTNEFFSIHINEQNKMILHTCGFTNDFFSIHINEQNKMIFPTRELTNIFFNSHR